MTQRDQGKQDGANDTDPGTRVLEADIDATRSAIGEDIKALGDRLSPETLREGARVVMHDAKEEAKELLREVKEEAVGSLREAKDGAVESLRSAKASAVESVTETVDEIGARARDMGDKSATFLIQNAVPLALIGVGIGWLTFGMRTQGSSARMRTSRATLRSRNPSQTREGPSLVSRAGGELQHAAQDAKARASELTHQATDRASELGHQIVDRGRELADEVQEQAQTASDRVMAYQEENPLAVGAVILAAGIGVGLALPSSNLERRLVGDVSHDMVDEAKRTARNLGATATATAKSIGTSLAENI